LAALPLVASKSVPAAMTSVKALLLEELIRRRPVELSQTPGRELCAMVSYIIPSGGPSWVMPRKRANETPQVVLYRDDDSTSSSNQTETFDSATGDVR
jgi:hypothetical protein